MSLIPKEALDALRAKIDLVALIRSKGINLKKHGSKTLKALSPFTDEKDPSFIVTPDKGLWHCMSSGKGGDVIKFIEEYEGVSFRHAFEILSGDDIDALLKSTAPVKKAVKRKLKAPVSFDADDQKLIKQTLAYYHKKLKETPAALEYLQKRGITAEAIDHFNIGFSDRTLGLRLPCKRTKDGKQVRDRLKKIGLYRETGREHFCGSAVFPVKNQSGNVVEIYGRKIRNDLRPGTIYHLYLHGVHQGIFNAKSLQSSDVVLCESIIDALTFWCNGIRNVTTAFGSQGFTDELFNAFVQHKTQRVYLAYDNDKAGNRCAQREAERFASVGIAVYRVRFPHGVDANAYALQAAPAQVRLQALLNASELLSTDNSTITSTSTESTAVNCQAAESAQTSKPVEPASQPARAVKEKNESLFKRTGNDYHAELGQRFYRVRGLQKNTTPDALKVNLCLRHGELFYLDELNFYQDKQREVYASRAASETQLEPELIKRDLGRLLFELEALQEKRMRDMLEPEDEIVLSEQDKAEALALLKEPNLLKRILADFDACGIVGEATNKLTGYIATVSRKLEKPLAIIIQSTSAAGKTALMDAVLSFLPPEESIKYSAMTGQSLYYLGETNIKHRVLAIAEEEGAERASYALKLLQSEGELTIASTGKDATTGRMETQEYHVEGPVMIFLTTTAIDIDEELMNRCLILTVDESKKQTEAIHELQREAETLEGLKRKKESIRILNTHRNAQRLLKPLNVVNPFAPYLSFRADRTRARRDHIKYLTLIKTIALLHQYQRPLIKRDGLEYIEVTMSDLEAANRLAHEVLGRSLDELPPQTRKLLVLLQEMVEQACSDKKIEQSDYRFTQRQIRAYTGWGNTQVKLHLLRLEELEYVAVYREGFGKANSYALLFDGKDDDQPHMMGLIDIDKVKKEKGTYDRNRSGQKGDRSE